MIKILSFSHTLIENRFLSFHVYLRQIEFIDDESCVTLVIKYVY